MLGAVCSFVELQGVHRQRNAGVALTLQVATAAHPMPLRLHLRLLSPTHPPACYTVQEPLVRTVYRRTAFQEASNNLVSLRMGGMPTCAIACLLGPRGGAGDAADAAGMSPLMRVGSRGWGCHPA